MSLSSSLSHEMTRRPSALRFRRRPEQLLQCTKLILVAESTETGGKRETGDEVKTGNGEWRLVDRADTLGERGQSQLGLPLLQLVQRVRNQSADENEEGRQLEMRDLYERGHAIILIKLVGL